MSEETVGRKSMRKNVIYSDQAIEEDRNRRFYCPNYACNAGLYICSIDGSKNAYFRATKPDSQHVENCPYGNRVAEFDNSKFDESKFDYDKAIENLICPTKRSSEVYGGNHHGNGEPGIHPPRTLKQIYSMCKSLNVKDYYSGKEISEMILDLRSAYRYPKGCFGNKIIEATVDKRFYDNVKKEIYLAAPITRGGVQIHIIVFR